MFIKLHKLVWADEGENVISNEEVNLNIYCISRVQINSTIDDYTDIYVDRKIITVIEDISVVLNKIENAYMGNVCGSIEAHESEYTENIIGLLGNIENRVEEILARICK